MGIELKDRFNLAMYDIYRRAKNEAKYNATRYLHMLDAHGGINTAHLLINSPTVSEGYTSLYLKGRLDLTVEALIWDNSEYHQLFSKEELRLIEKRLKEYRYGPVLSQRSD
jgi:hypothetical protein